MRAGGVALALLGARATTCAAAAENFAAPRTVIAWDGDWRFHLGDIPAASAADFDDHGWGAVRLPHDWAIAGPIARNNPGIERSGFFPGGIGWYRKSFRLPAAAGRQVRVTFDGVHKNAEVWINGHSLGRHVNGYDSFTLDLTAHLRADGGANVLAVRVDDSQQPSSRWYTGSGIYRHVWLTLSDALHVAPDGVFVTTPEVSPARATVRVVVEIANRSPASVTAQVTHRIQRDGHTVATLPAVEAVVAAGAVASVAGAGELPAPALWSVESPALYSLVTEVARAGRVVDHVETSFGVRQLEFSHEEGFRLNGRTVKLQGVCLHHDGGPVGAAVPEDVWRRRLLLLREMGCNAIRTGHAPMAPEFYALCDELGFLVMGEILDEWRTAKKDMAAFGYNRHFATEAEADIASAVRRDRNHPSIFMWSIGNEVAERGTPGAVADAKRLVAFVHGLDATRPVTSGINYMAEANASGFADAFDVTGYNDGGGCVFLYDEDRAKFPARKFIGTEHPHSMHTRGVYRTTTRMREKVSGHPPEPDLAPWEVFPEWEKDPNYYSSYDNHYVWLNERDSWRLTASRPHIMGEFRWTGIDYLGESRGWPNRATPSGLLDLAGFPKDSYYLYQSRWTRAPMVHLLPHWTWPGKEGVAIPVVAYANADEVELFQDGVSLGRQPMTLAWQIKWMVPYRAGELRAVAYREGRPVAEDVQRTAGPARRLQLELDRRELRANQRDVVHATVRILDEQGNFVPAAASELAFSVRGPARLLGTENGDTIDHTRAASPQRRAFMGLCLALCQATAQPGEVEITVASGGLAPATARFKVIPAGGTAP